MRRCMHQSARAQWAFSKAVQGPSPPLQQRPELAILVFDVAVPQHAQHASELPLADESLPLPGSWLEGVQGCLTCHPHSCGGVHA